MIRQVGKKRNFKTNIQVASTLSMTAGIVNVASLIAFYVLTTNVTGHMAIFSEEIVKGHWHQVQIVFIWLFLFFFGAFTSTWIVNTVGATNPRRANTLPLILELIIFIGVGLYGLFFYEGHLRETEILSAILLFSMGLQNALVTTISNAVVRTTHLTGLFTDLGIGVAMLMTSKTVDKDPVKKKVILLSTIAFFYFLGGIIGGLLYLNFEFYAFFAAAAIILISLYWDHSRIALYRANKSTRMLFKNKQQRQGSLGRNLDKNEALAEKERLGQS